MAAGVTHRALSNPAQCRTRPCAPDIRLFKDVCRRSRYRVREEPREPDHLPGTRRPARTRVRTAQPGFSRRLAISARCAAREWWIPPPGGSTPVDARHGRPGGGGTGAAVVWISFAEERRFPWRRSAI